MSAEYSIITPQTVQPNQPAVFLDSPCPCAEGFILKKSGGVFLLANNAPATSACSCGCGCRRIYTTNYEVEVHANIEIPTGGTVEEIQLALAVDGVVDPASVMSFTPAAVETAGNIGTSIIVSVPNICGCDSLAVVNASTQPITINNASLVFDYAGVQRLN
ncbi:hypothetical protein [Ruminococcus flavefaciens]|uniref:hypothetical protein n=1 Tax=Ruminococcus flavefaciens TaxID=1265 RepID=UPI0026EAFFD4|nr:hypothetical protein [Ruminococcus flavefaciens]